MRQEDPENIVEGAWGGRRQVKIDDEMWRVIENVLGGNPAIVLSEKKAEHQRSVPHKATDFPRCIVKNNIFMQTLRITTSFMCYNSIRFKRSGAIDQLLSSRWPMWHESIHSINRFSFSFSINRSLFSTILFSFLFFSLSKRSLFQNVAKWCFSFWFLSKAVVRGNYF